MDDLVNDAIQAKDRNKLQILISLYDELLTNHKLSPRLTYQKARTLNALAQIDRSNAILENAIDAFNEVLSLTSKVPEKLFRKAGSKCVELLKFRGWYDKAITIQKAIIKRFPNAHDERNNLGTLLLYVAKNAEAKTMFEQVLKQHPDNGYALVHLGFILKLEGSVSSSSTGNSNENMVMEGRKNLLKRSAELLHKGIQTREAGTMEGKFYFHLADALQRLGKSSEANEIYQAAADEGAMPSFWQRSLYNIDGLKAQPVWQLEETGIADQLQVLQQSWKLIRDEALAVLKQNLFESEGENLRDTGKWAQFELYRQGQKSERNCKKAPITCKLVSSIPQVASNRRGQVKFSVMESGTHVHAHSGPTNCRLRVHLGLKIPADDQSGTQPRTAVSHSGKTSVEDTILRVADRYLKWADGEIFVFDDSFDHEVWHYNQQQESRIVLILDLWHPDLNAYQRQTLPAI